MEAVSHSTRSKRPRLDAATYSLVELAGLLGISYTTAHEMAQAGALPVTPLKVGRVYKFPKSEVHRLLAIESGNTTEPDRAA